MKLKQYAVWQEKDEYFHYYDTLYEAVSENGDGEGGTEVFEVTLKSIGKYELKHSVRKVKKEGK